MRRGLCALLVLALLSGCTAVRLCGVGALNPAKECVVVFQGDAYGQITGTGAQLVPRGLYPSAPASRPAWEIEMDERCGREALRAQQAYYSRHGVPTPYAPLEARCKRRAIVQHRQKGDR